MRHVSSRQRLVSWDASDATATTESRDSDTSSGFAFDNSHEDRPKRKRSPKQGTSSIPAYFWEIDDPHSLFTSVLNDDVHLQILEFCDLDSLRNVMQVNHRYHNLLCATQAKVLWTQVARRRWNWLPADANLVDAGKDPKISLLLSLACEHNPTKVDESVFSPCRWSRSLRRNRTRTSTTGESGELKTLQLKDRTTGVQFTGPIGQGDRCIRANAPLQRPALLKHRSSWLSRFHCNQLQNNTQVCRPFVAPFLHKNYTYHVTPRLVAYFEVSILDTKNGSAPSQHHFELQDHLNRTSTSATECVAIGLASEEFSLHTRMP
jgi:hypothetical protein